MPARATDAATTPRNLRRETSSDEAGVLGSALGELALHGSDELRGLREIVEGAPVALAVGRGLSRREPEAFSKASAGMWVSVIGGRRSSAAAG
jgi:hypothetical protein